MLHHCPNQRELQELRPEINTLLQNAQTFFFMTTTIRLCISNNPLVHMHTVIHEKSNLHVDVPA